MLMMALVENENSYELDITPWWSSLLNIVYLFGLLFLASRVISTKNRTIYTNFSSAMGQ
jgi:hypothetical protein